MIRTQEDVRISTVALREFLKGREWFDAVRALEMAREHHTGYRKDNVTPEISHQLWIAHYVCNISHGLILPEETVTVALLHDVVEDYNVRKQQITEEFSQGIATSVMILSKLIDGVRKSDEHYYSEIAMCPAASIVKGVDRLHNFSTMPGVFTQEKQISYISEGEEKVLPMLKTARRRFPRQDGAYQNIKLVMECQIDLINRSLEQPSAA